MKSNLNLLNTHEQKKIEILFTIVWEFHFDKWTTVT